MTNRQLFEKYQNIKKDTGLSFYDTHIHPHDVFGLAKAEKVSFGEKIKVSGPTLLEKLKYSNSALSLLGFLFRNTPGYITREIKKSFPVISEQKLLEVLSASLIDSAVLVPIYPKVSPYELYKSFSSSKFIRLGSADFSLNEIDLEKDLGQQLNMHSIKGIKLHPNIQSFYPEPSRNNITVESKLKVVYQFANKNNLYLLFHGGISYVPTGFSYERREYALLNRFFSGRKSFLADINVPVVIAHLGIYNIKEPDFKIIRRISEFENVHFDTAAVNPKYILNYLNYFTPKKLVFGSDTLYFNLKYNLEMFLRTLYAHSDSKFEENVLSVFHSNFVNNVLRIRS